MKEFPAGSSSIISTPNCLVVIVDLRILTTGRRPMIHATPTLHVVQGPQQTPMQFHSTHAGPQQSPMSTLLIVLLISAATGS